MTKNCLKARKPSVLYKLSNLFIAIIVVIPLYYILDFLDTPKLNTGTGGIFSVNVSKSIYIADKNEVDIFSFIDSCRNPLRPRIFETFSGSFIDREKNTLLGSVKIECN